MGKPIDLVLKLCATCTKEQLVETVQTVCEQIDEEERAGNTAGAAITRDLCRVLDAMGELRFSRWWPANSPARRRDEGDRAFMLASNTRAVQ